MSTDAALQFFYGGTFDPVHNGHLAIARAARDELKCTLRLMPAADPPHRAAPGANALQRAQMLDLAVADETGLVVDRRELGREGRSYTIDTLHQLRAEHGPGLPIALLIGADSFTGLPGWRDWQALFDLAHFVVAPRPGSPLDGALPQELASAVSGRWTASPEVLKNTPAGRLFLLGQPLHPESASEIRRRIAGQEVWQGLVPPAVAAYISANGLYSRPADRRSPL
ncbi:MAG TPA: nicotinate-nucleotide adenylyltransferase [Pseudoxanthomonas sp.]|nr:nicotinate-nucleotide adenylyltransferase [Pseudoxanthomonas sp.]